VLVAVLSATLLREGWTLDYAPGRLHLHRQHFAIDPRNVITRMRNRELSQDRWRQMIVTFELDPNTPMGGGI
jgi:hypothetical protein